MVAQNNNKGTGRLFPHAVCRVAGLPVRYLESLRAEDSWVGYTEARDMVAQLDGARESLTDAIYEAIGGQEDRALRRALLRARRDIHNGRIPRANDVETAAKALTPESGERLRVFRQLSLQHQQAEADLLTTCKREIVEIRRRFQQAVGDQDFRRGLLLSSRTLAGELPRYVKKKAEKPGSKGRQIERSLMRYFSRMVMKSTPFGTFCALLPGRLTTETEAEGGAPVFDGDPRAKRSWLRLNKSIYAQLLMHLLSRPEIRRSIHVELNPTLRLEQGKWLFLAAIDNREVFQRLPPNPVLDLLRQMLDDRPHLPLEALIDELRSNPEIEASQDEAVAFLDRLLEIGFLRFRIGIAEQEVNWDRPLKQILEGVDDEHAVAICRFLDDLRANLEAYASADLDQRRQLISMTSERIVDLFDQLDAKVKPWGEMPPFYEDTGGSASLELDSGLIDPELAGDLADYARLTSRISWPRTEQAAMRHFFDTFYGADRGPVPLLQFYEDYFREHFKAHLERQHHGHAAHRPPTPDAAEAETNEDGEPPAVESYNLMNPFGLEIVTAIQDAHQKLGSRLRELWRENPDAAEVSLEREELEAVLAEVPEGQDPCRSVSFFVQVLPGFADGQSALVANSFYNGYGKYFSRFLYLLPEAIEADLASGNAVLSTQELAEICGDASFNANLHPPLLPWEVSYPTGESGATEKQIKTSDVVAEPDPEDPHRLRLRRGSTGKEVIPVDLGFLNPRMRPPLFQLLSRFTPPATFSTHLPDSPADEAAGEPVCYRPRFTYRGRLVLARRQWRFLPDAFPKRQAKETEAEYFLRLQSWREEHGLPEEVFVRVQALPSRPPSLAASPDKASPETEAEEAASEEAPASEETPKRAVSSKETGGSGAKTVAAAKAVPSEKPVEKRVEQTAEETSEEQLSEAGGEKTPKPRSAPQRRVRQHLHKPQYIDFRNPLLVDLFSRVTENLEYFVVRIEERLPAAEHLARSGDDRYVTEQVLQIDFPEPREDNLDA